MQNCNNKKESRKKDEEKSNHLKETIYRNEFHKVDGMTYFYI